MRIGALAAVLLCVPGTAWALTCWDDLVRMGDYFGSVTPGQVSKCLITERADPNYRDRKGFTPLHLLVTESFVREAVAVEIIRLMVEHGADPNAMMGEYSPLRTARELFGEGSDVYAALSDVPGASAAAGAGGWGAIFWALPSERDDRNLDHIPIRDRRCHHVAGMAWNYPTRLEAMTAARDVCRDEWRKSGTRVRMKTGDCGDLTYDDPIRAGTVLGVIFGPGECASYAKGQHHVSDAVCPVSGTGVGASESEADRNALADCEEYGDCRVTMSACNTLR